MPRRYEQRQRAERHAETRRRIVEATVALHQTLGVARTTISEIAAEAGVERATVYRHFPDERTLISACTGHYAISHPLPDPTAWGAIADPASRLRAGLTAIYTYYRETEPMTERALRDLPDSPVLQEILTPYFSYWTSVQEMMAAGWSVPEDRRALVRAAVGHAMAFSTWRSLVREQGLAEDAAITLMTTMVECFCRACCD